MSRATTRAAVPSTPTSCASPSSRARARARVSTSRDVAASTSTSTATDGVGFSAAGFFFPYHVGVWEELVALEVMRADETPCAGASAGSLVAAMHCCGLTPEDGKRILMDVLADCRKNGVVGRVGAVLEKALRRELPSDAHERCSRGNLFISVSSPTRRDGKFTLDGQLLSNFDSFDDLVGALLASCHIPLYCGWPARRYRGRWCVDGGWHNLTPTPPNAERSVRVCSFPLLDAWHKAAPGDGEKSGDIFAQQASFWAGWGNDDAAGLLVAPDAAGGKPEWDYSEAIRFALLPGSDDILEEMVVMGRMDARRWAKNAGFDIERTIESASVESKVTM